MSELVDETDVLTEWPSDPIGHSLFAIGYGLSMAGGLLMVVIALMVVVSIAGRALIAKPIYGDFELVAMGTAISVFLFLPYCHLTRNNVIVDLFLAKAPEKVKIACDVVASVLLAIIATMLVWRSWIGGISMYDVNETTMILSVPVWVAFPFIVGSLSILSLCCIYTAVTDFRRLIK